MTTTEITNFIKRKIASHFANGDDIFIDILSGDIQKELNIKDMTPQVCKGMRYVAKIYPHQEIYTPNKGAGTKLKIRYYKDIVAFSSAEKIDTIVGKPKGVAVECANTIDMYKQVDMIEPEIIKGNIVNFYNKIIEDPNYRFKSWEHCHKFFKNNRKLKDESNLDLFSLHLAFYLASWGMLRGSSFLLRKDYLVHKPAIKIILSDKYENLWKNETELVGEIELLRDEVNLIFDCCEKITKSYREQKNCKDPSTVLLTKILLGVYGCTPAYDRFFIEGLKKYGLTANYSKSSLNEVFDFYTRNCKAFETCRKEIKKGYGADYPPMKLVDMFFWEEGRKLSDKTYDEALDVREE